MKKYFITLIALLLSLAASAAVQYNGLWYNLNTNDNTAEVVSSQGSQYSGNISIPTWAYYQNTSYKVTSIGNSAFEGCVDVTSVSIPSSVTSIGNGAFWQCSSLKSVYIPDGVKTIGEGAFHNCFNLVSVFIPSSVTSIGSSAFGNCNNLTQVFSLIQNPFSINNNVFTTYSTTTLFTPKGTKSAYLAKSGWKEFTTINDEQKRTINVATAGTLSNLISKNEMYYIEELTLSGELNGRDIRLIRNMSGIDWEYECPYCTLSEAVDIFTAGKLKILDILNAKIVGGGGSYYEYGGSDSRPTKSCCTEDNKITTYMFYKCKLTSIRIPNSVTSICSNAFDDTEWYNNQPNGLVYVGNFAYKYKGTMPYNTSITINNGTVGIVDYAFSDCSGLTSITIPNSVTSIGYGAFDNTGWYNNQPDGLVYAGKVAYKYKGTMPNNTSITIKDGTVGITESAFYGCSGLTSITIPNSVTSIGSVAFSYCNGLTTIVSEIETPFAIDDYVFYYYAKDIYATATLIVPPGKKSAYQNTAGWKKFTNIVEAGQGGIIGQVFEAGGIFYKIQDNGYNVTVVRGSTKYKGDIIIPEKVNYNGKVYNVTCIGEKAFMETFGLTSVTIPNSVSSITDQAFADCDLNTIVIPPSVTSITLYAFEETMLKSVHISSIEAWCNIVFDHPYSNPLYRHASLYMDGKEIKDLVIPHGVTSISSYAFFGSCLTSITIPKSVISIGTSAFSSGFSDSSNILTSMKVESGNVVYDSRDNCNAIIETTSNTLLFGCKNTVIPNSVTSIGNDAFSKCKGLTSITIPNSVTNIGDYAFGGCSGLTSIISLNNTPPTCTQGLYGGYTQFSSVDKTNCIVWVPRRSANSYKDADGWKDFQNIGELALGDVNVDFEVNKTDLNATTNHIMGQNPEGFYESLADLNGDEAVNAADVVKLVTILNIQDGLSTDWQFNYNSSQVVSSLSCTFNNDGNKAIQLTKCELYCNQILAGSANFKVTLGTGGNKSCTFNDLSSFSTKTGFSVVWYYTYNGESYTYSCDLTE